MAPKRKRGGATKAAAPRAKAAKTEPALSPVSKGDALFNTYADESEPDVIGPEGIEKLCKSLSVSPADRRVLLLAWKMGAARMGYFSRQEFTSGLKALSCTTTAQLKKALPRLDTMVNSPAVFDEFYDFAFRFCLTDPGQKIVDIETVAQMLQIVLPDGRFVEAFCQFLTEQQDYKKINSDQWSNFLRFSREVAADMSNAGDNPAWPVLLDNFVDWFQARGSPMKD